MKHYSKEFKEEALKLSDEIGVKKAAQQLGNDGLCFLAGRFFALLRVDRLEHFCYNFDLRFRHSIKNIVEWYGRETGNVKKCAVGKYPKSEKHGNTAQFSEVERSGTQENCGGIESGCRLRLRPLPVLRRRQSQRVARIDPNAVVVDKNIAENDRFDLFSR